MGLLAILFAVVLVAPILTQAFADVYVPPGPCYNMSEWITPSLSVYNMNATGMPKIGWMYSNGPMYNETSQMNYPKIEASSPQVVGATDVGFGTGVMILGFIPGVTVSMDETPPAIELTITWNGVPNTVTLTQTTPVGANVPPTIQKDITGVYQAAFPGTEAGKNINKHAQWNVYYGPWSSVLATEFGVTPAAWTYKSYGLFFWYKFIPNVGDYISFDCTGKINDPPTYDVTALLEYGTSQVWFNHVCWNVDFLQLHKTVQYETGVLTGYGSTTAMDNVLIHNVGLITATNISLIQNLPAQPKYGVQPIVPATAQAMIQKKDGTLVVPFTPISFPEDVWFILPAPFNTLKAGQNLTITEELEVYNVWTSGRSAPNVEIVFDSMCAANEIPAWKDPIGLYAIPIGSPSGSSVYLFQGNELLVGTGTGTFGNYATFGINPEWPVPTPILRMPLTEPAMSMVLDPVPVSLSGGSLVTSADVNLVRAVICGLAPYDARMDLVAKGSVNLQDLAAYKAAAGQ